VRPLVQTFAMIVLPSESEINKTWQAQVVEPFRTTLAAKYPFAAGAQVQATPGEIGQVFGPEGAVAKFVGATMGPLVVRRGDVLSSRTWADIGITLAPQAVSGFPGWIAPLSANGVAAGNGPQTIFQLLPLPASGVTEYTIEIDGQQLRYRNTPPAWVNMVHPGPQTAGGAKISAVTFDGRSVELFNVPGQFGLQKMIEAAANKRVDAATHELRWSAGNVAVAVNLKRISSADAGVGADAQASQGFRGLRLPEAIVGGGDRAAAGSGGSGAMSRAPLRAGAGRIGYFGKLPARGDFVRQADDGAVLGMLDDWLAQVMSRLPADARWKLNYDAMAPASFAFVGLDRRHAVAGHLVASHDQSGRRFPFLMMRTVDVPDPAGFAARCPLAFGPLWRHLEAMAPCACASADPGPQLQAVAEAQVELGEYDAALADFLAVSTVGTLSSDLALAANRMILGLGLLLQPVMHSRPAALQKSLVLPLPVAPDLHYPTAAFWLELVTPFIRRSGFDLALFLTTVRGRPSLVVGFGGEAADTLHALIDPLVAVDHQVHLDDNDWIDEQLGIDIDVRALASYLEQPMLPLRLARELFLKTFIGAAA